eukprot:6186932-Pleurochrysis_carterae.AAC.2
MIARLKSVPCWITFDKLGRLAQDQLFLPLLGTALQLERLASSGAVQIMFLRILTLSSVRPYRRGSAWGSFSVLAARCAGYYSLYLVSGMSVNRLGNLSAAGQELSGGSRCAVYVAHFASVRHATAFSFMSGNALYCFTTAHKSGQCAVRGDTDDSEAVAESGANARIGHRSSPFDVCTVRVAYTVSCIDGKLRSSEET